MTLFFKGFPSSLSGEGGRKPPDAALRAELTTPRTPAVRGEAAGDGAALDAGGTDFALCSENIMFALHNSYAGIWNL